MSPSDQLEPVTLAILCRAASRLCPSAAASFPFPFLLGSAEEYRPVPMHDIDDLRHRTCRLRQGPARCSGFSLGSAQEGANVMRGTGDRKD